VQTPHPPLFLACSRYETVRVAARYGIGALVLGYDGPLAMADTRQMYDDELAKGDTSEHVSPGNVNREFVALCPTVLSEDADEGLRLGARAQRFFAEAIQHWSAPGFPAPAHHTENVDNVAYMRMRAEQIEEEHAKLAAQGQVEARDSRYFSGRIWSLDHPFGDPDKAVKYVQQLKDGGVTDVMCMIQMGTLTHAQCMNTIRLWGEYVIPKFR